MAEFDYRTFCFRFVFLEINALSLCERAEIINDNSDCMLRIDFKKKRKI